MNWFANVGKYLWSREATPYFTAPEAMTEVQARHEVFAYAVLLGSVFAIVGIGGVVAAFRNPAPAPLLWAATCAVVLWACAALPRLRGTLAAWIVATAPAVLLVQFALSGFSPQSTGADQVLLVIIILVLLRYGWRIVRIARYQTGRPAHERAPPIRHLFQKRNDTAG